jgi:hypothetical protein
MLGCVNLNNHRPYERFFKMVEKENNREKDRVLAEDEFLEFLDELPDTASLIPKDTVGAGGFIRSTFQARLYLVVGSDYSPEEKAEVVLRDCIWGHNCFDFGTGGYYTLTERSVLYDAPLITVPAGALGLLEDQPMTVEDLGLLVTQTFPQQVSEALLEGLETEEEEGWVPVKALVTLTIEVQDGVEVPAHLSLRERAVEILRQWDFDAFKSWDSHSLIAAKIEVEADEHTPAITLEATGDFLQGLKYQFLDRCHRFDPRMLDPDTVFLIGRNDMVTSQEAAAIFSQPIIYDPTTPSPTEGRSASPGEVDI